MECNVLRFGDILAPKEIVGRYEVIDVLSANTGFGLILIARDKKVLGRKVLLKTTNYKNKIKRTNLENEKIIEKRRKEIENEKKIIEILNSIGVFNIPIIRDFIFGYNPTIHWPESKIIPGKQFLPEYAFNEPYIVLQYIDGVTLTDYVKNNIKDKNSPEWQLEVLKIAKQLLKVFFIVHEKVKKKFNISFVYQDLKPDNILISHNKSFILIDFGGVAVKQHDTGKIHNWGVGTPGYMAPEVKDKNMTFDGRVDIYSLGIMMFELLSYEPLGNYVNEKGIVENLNINSLKVHDLIKEIIQKATNYLPDLRYKDVQEMLEDVIKAMKAINSLIGK